MAQQISLTKTLVASSSLALGLFSSAGTTLYTTGSSASVGTSTGAVATALDTGRRIILWSTGDNSGLLISLSGQTSAGRPVTETLSGSLASSFRETKQDFYIVTSVSFSSQNPINSAQHVATSSHGGTPWITTDTWRNPTDLTAQITLSATNNSMSANFECAVDDITQITPNAVRTISSDGSNPVPWYPLPFISQQAGSTFISTCIDALTVGTITTPIAAWRMTLTSSSSTAGIATVSVLQSG
jgi:hypothetical protein